MTNDDFEVDPTGTGKALVDSELEVARLRWALHQIVDIDSCLLADAQEIAKEALRERE